MSASADLSLSTPTLPAAQHSTLEKLIVAVLDRTIDSAEGIRQVFANRRKRRAWRQDLPWNVGMDHLAETGCPPWIHRP
jgi:hypothetical protein